jgi:hypothetical protein
VVTVMCGLCSTSMDIYWSNYWNCLICRDSLLWWKEASSSHWVAHMQCLINVEGKYKSRVTWAQLRTILKALEIPMESNKLHSWAYIVGLLLPLHSSLFCRSWFWNMYLTNIYANFHFRICCLGEILISENF